jgi:Zinc knuckle
MSGRGHGRSRGQGRGAGRGRSFPQAAQAKGFKEPQFKGHNSELPTLNFGASAKENKPIEFLQLMGEHAAIVSKPSICFAYWTTPPAYGDEDEEPEIPAEIPAGNLGKIVLAKYLTAHKDWTSDTKKITEDKLAAFSLTYGQLSESSRCEVQDDEEWVENYNERNLLYLIQRIRATHIARRTGNPGQDRERVQMAWANIRMQPHETSFAFRKRVDDHQLERTSVGLPVIPEDELVVGILNRLDMSRYATLARDYFDNERRGIAALPEASSTLWKEVKDAQVIRFRGTRVNDLESIYLTRVDEIKIDGGRGRGRGSRATRGGRGGRGRGRFSNEEKGHLDDIKTTATASPITPDNIICWTCGKKGHRSNICPIKRVHFAAAEDDETIFLTRTVPDNCTPPLKNSSHDLGERTTSVFLSNVSGCEDTVLMLDTQSGIHLIRNPGILTTIMPSQFPITVQGITKDKVKIKDEGIIQGINIKGYYSPHMAANIISYHKLKDTHTVHYNEATDVFTAVSDSSPTLTFKCVDGHYIMDLDIVRQAYVVSISSRAAKYSLRQLSAARNAYEFMQRMGYISYKAAAEIVQRGSMKDIGFTRADLVNAQDIYGSSAAYQLGHGTQRATKCNDDDKIPIHQSVNQDLQVDLFYFLGQTFFLSNSVLLGLIMVSHLGPGNDSDSSGAERSRSKAGKALFLHLAEYQAKGFRVTSVTSDGEGAIKSCRKEIQALGVDLNILGRGSHAPHAESAIRHIKKQGPEHSSQSALRHLGQTSSPFDRIRSSHVKYGAESELARASPRLYGLQRSGSKLQDRCTVPIRNSRFLAKSPNYAKQHSTPKSRLLRVVRNHTQPQGYSQVPQPRHFTRANRRRLSPRTFHTVRYRTPQQTLRNSNYGRNRHQSLRSGT